MDQLQNPKSEGTLIVQTTSGSLSVPVPGVTVIVRMARENGNSDILRVLVTNESGRTAPIRIETPSAAESLTPSGTKPYTEISAEILAPGYYDTVITGIPVYPGITSLQPVRMIPRPERENAAGTPEKTVVISEGSSLPSL